MLMNRLTVLLILLIVLVSCDNKRGNYTEVDEDGNIVLTEESKAILQEIEDDYFACYDGKSAGDQDCIHFTSEAICRFYEIDDFKDGESYMSYKEIKDKISGLEGWQVVGQASSQSALDEAQDLANTGRAVVALDPKKNYHTAIILPGMMVKSGSWGLKCPNSASFFRHKVKAYFDKPLSYSYTSPEGLMIYAREE